MSDGNYGTGNYGADYYSAALDIAATVSVPAASSDASAGTIIHVAQAQNVLAVSAASAANAFRLAVGFISFLASSAVSAVGNLFWVPGQTSGATWVEPTLPVDPWTQPSPSSVTWTITPPQN